jgi:hypothetical protein
VIPRPVVFVPRPCVGALSISQSASIHENLHDLWLFLPADNWIALSASRMVMMNRRCSDPPHPQRPGDAHAVHRAIATAKVQPRRFSNQIRWRCSSFGHCYQSCRTRQYYTTHQPHPTVSQRLLPHGSDPANREIRPDCHPQAPKW